MRHLKCMTREIIFLLAITTECHLAEYQGNTEPCNGDMKIAEYFKTIVLSNDKNLKGKKITGFLVGDLLHELV